MSAMLEIQLSRAIQKGLIISTAPTEFKEFKYYYLGFYIHKCKKMRYKGQFEPSEILCTETSTYIPFQNIHGVVDSPDNDLLNRLNAKNPRLNPDLSIPSIWKRLALRNY